MVDGMCDTWMSGWMIDGSNPLFTLNNYIKWMMINNIILEMINCVIMFNQLVITIIRIDILVLAFVVCTCTDG